MIVINLYQKLNVVKIQVKVTVNKHHVINIIIIVQKNVINIMVKMDNNVFIMVIYLNHYVLNKIMVIKYNNVYNNYNMYNVDIIYLYHNVLILIIINMMIKLMYVLIIQ